MRGSTMVVLAALVFSTLACSGETPTEPMDAAPPAIEAAVPAPPAAPAAAAATVYTLTELQNGDIACYVVLKDGAGVETTIPGDFELCAGAGHDATSLIGKSVVITTSKESVQAASCQGDPDCKDSEIVDLVATITAAP